MKKTLYDIKIEEAEKAMELKDRDDDALTCAFHCKECDNCGKCDEE
jgi:hypothetical protein